MKISYSIFCAAILLFFLSCENEESLVGQNVVAEANNVIVSYPENDTDNDEIIIEQKLHSNMPALAGDISLFGAFFDPIFGHTVGGVGFQIKPEGLVEGDISKTEISAISLTIPYLGYYAQESMTMDLISNMGLEVRLIEHSLDNVLDLYIHQTWEEYEIVEALTRTCSDSYGINIASLEKTNDYLTLDLNGCIAPDELLAAFGDNEDLNTVQNEFVNNFPALFLNPRLLVGESMLYLNINDATLSVLYDNNDTLQFVVGVDDGMMAFNLFDCLFDTVPSPSELYSYDESKLYLQSMGGAFPIIDMPFLNELKDKGYIAANTAELILHVAENNGDFVLPDKLKLYQYVENETSLNLDNNYLVAESNSLNSENNSYTFDLSAPILDVMNGELNPKFKLFIDSPTSQINRLVLDGDIELNLLLIKEQD